MLITRKTMELLTVNKVAPAFTLPNQDDEKISLKDYKGSWVLVYFYPKDNTPGCTIEAQVLRDAHTELTKHGLVVLGISADSVASHKKFSEKQKLTFDLLSDPEKKTIAAYGAFGPKKFMGREFDGIHRISYLINPAGKIAKVYEKVKPIDHAAEVLADVKELKN